MSGIIYKRSGSYNVAFRSYCGMDYTIAENVDLNAAKTIVKERIRSARCQGQPVTKLGKGEWEFETPEDAALISDEEGVLSVNPHYNRFRRILGRLMRI